MEMPFINVKKGDHLNVFMNLQVIKNLPKTGLFKLTGSDKENCINDKNYDLDKLERKIVHQKFHEKFGCVIPLYGGMHLDRNNYKVCTNTVRIESVNSMKSTKFE